MELKMNSYQTPINDTLKEALPKEVWEDLMEFIATVPMIKNLIAEVGVRGLAKDRPRMKEHPDKIVVDLTAPHILEDIDFFRERALFFIKNGRYTNIPINSNPKSEYAAFWKEEVRRWKHGLVRESDGEWIPGKLYFYWNYSPIWLTVNVNEIKPTVEEWLESIKSGDKEKSDKTEGERKQTFPNPWLGDYIFYHYIKQARSAGKHGKLLKTRGIGYSLKMGAISPCNMYTLPGSGNPNFHLASDKTFLTGDKGVFGKVMDVLDWIAKHTPLPKLRILDSKRAMEIQLGYQDEYGVRQGLLSSVFGVSLKDNPDKARGIRGPLIHYEEDGLFPNLEKAWSVNRKAVEDGNVAFGFMIAGGCLTKNNKVWTKDGQLLPLNEITKKDGIIGYDGDGAYQEDIGWFKEPEKKECVIITTSGGDKIECSIDHPILTTMPHWKRIIKNKSTGKYCKATYAGDIKIGDQILSADSIPFFGTEHVEDARLIGLAIGDGCYKSNQSVRVACGDDEVYEYLNNKYECSYSKMTTQKDGSNYCNLTVKKVIPKFREAGIYGDVNGDKKLPLNIHKYNKESLSKLIGGYFDADGSVYYNKKRNRVRVVLTSKYIHLLEQIRDQLYKFGIHGKISKEYRKGGFKPGVIYRLYINSYTDLVRFKKEIPLLCTHKSKTLSFIDKMSIIDRTRTKRHYFKVGDNLKGGYFQNRNKPLLNTKTASVSKVEFIGKQTIYNLHTLHSNTYLAGNIITFQTGGTMGKSFEGSEKLFYRPNAYNIYGIPNVFDKNINGETKCGLFWGAYLNRHMCYDIATGEPDVIKALVEILLDRFKVKYSSSDPSAITQKKAEEPITPQEAVMRTEGTVFPVADLKEYIETIAPRRETFLAEHYVGYLFYQADGSIGWKPDLSLYPLRSYNVTAGDRTGALEIFEMPRKNNAGNIPYGRYIAGIDPIDADAGQSLFSILVMDTFTDRIVAEYSGRPRTANEAYEMALKTLKFYNAQANYESNLKGLFSYFNNKNALHYLAETPQVLRDMEIVKSSGYGNQSKGSHANAKLNSWGRLLQADWMVTKAYSTDPDDERLNLHRLRSIPYIEEAIYWNADGNFDRVSAGIMLFILREERIKRTETTRNNLDKQVNKIANDPYFTRNFSKKDGYGLVEKNLKRKFNFE